MVTLVRIKILHAYLVNEKNVLERYVIRTKKRSYFKVHNTEHHSNRHLQTKHVFSHQKHLYRFPQACTISLTNRNQQIRWRIWLTRPKNVKKRGTITRKSQCSSRNSKQLRNYDNKRRLTQTVNSLRGKMMRRRNIKRNDAATFFSSDRFTRREEGKRRVRM